MTACVNTAGQRGPSPILREEKWEWNAQSLCACMLAAVLAILVGWEPEPVHASEMIQTRDYRIMAGDITVPVDLVFSQFDPRLGTLLHVEAVFQLTEQSASIDYENTIGSAAASDIEIGKVVNYVGPGLLIDDQTSLFDAVTLFRGRVDLGAFDGVFDFAGPDSFAFRQPTPAGNTLSAHRPPFCPTWGRALSRLRSSASWGRASSTRKTGRVTESRRPPAPILTAGSSGRGPWRS